MMNARGIARLGVLAVGLGIGTAVAPGIASADSSTDWLSNVSGAAAIPVLPTSDLNLAISVDGYSLLQEGTASATSGTGDFAIAFGDGADASALGGFGDVATAAGTDAVAKAGGASAETFDTALDIGNNGNVDPDAPVLPAGYIDGAYAGDGTGSSDTAMEFGNNDFAVAGIGSNDSASVLASSSIADAGGNLTNAGLAGNNDIATVLDPLPGSYAEYPSYAEAGASDTAPGNSDFAAAIFSPGEGADVQGVNDIYSVVAPFATDPITGTAAATGGDLLTDLLPGLGEGTASSGANLLADLLSLF
ncbi:MAG: hypothetical protein WB777_07605 [Mycobacterium sp.]